jgi:threonine synthase
LYPHGRVRRAASDDHAKLTESNVHAIAVDGDFLTIAAAACWTCSTTLEFRDGVKPAGEFDQLGPGCLQVVYHFTAAVLCWARRAVKLTLLVLIGNFGDIFGGAISLLDGLIADLVIATN